MFGTFRLVFTSYRPLSKAIGDCSVVNEAICLRILICFINDSIDSKRGG